MGLKSDLRSSALVRFSLPLDDPVNLFLETTAGLMQEHPRQNASGFGFFFGEFTGLLFLIDLHSSLGCLSLFHYF